MSDTITMVSTVIIITFAVMTFRALSETRRITEDIFPDAITGQTLDLILEEPRDCADPHCYARRDSRADSMDHQHLTTRRVTAHVMAVSTRGPR